GARLLAANLACDLALKYSLGATPLREIPASGSMGFMIFTIAPLLAVKGRRRSPVLTLCRIMTPACDVRSPTQSARRRRPAVSPPVVVKRRRAQKELNGDLDGTERSCAPSPGLPVLKVSEGSDLRERTAG